MTTPVIALVYQTLACRYHGVFWTDGRGRAFFIWFYICFHQLSKFLLKSIFNYGFIDVN